MSKHLDPSTKPEHRIVVVGDLHGMVHKAKALWRTLEETLTQPVLLSALVVFLGDYCDRGLYTRELLCWLTSLQQERARRGARTICLLGNHEFCLLGFLGLLPAPKADPDFLFRHTWDKDDVNRNERERWWGEGEDQEVLDLIHLQGRRWGGSWYEKSYGSTATFASYSVERGDREGLRRSMPEEHLDFLQRCPWVHIEESPLLGRCVFVHAGLEADGSPDCAAQLQQLQGRDARQLQPEPLFGRDGVLHTPPQLARIGTTVVSGHHGRVMLRTHRLIVDNCAGDERSTLAAMVLPEMVLVHHGGEVEAKDPGLVFPGRTRFRKTAATQQGFAQQLGFQEPPTPPLQEPQPFCATPPAPQPCSPGSWRPCGRPHQRGPSASAADGWALRMPQGDSSPLEN